jgi:hypothetical protein
MVLDDEPTFDSFLFKKKSEPLGKHEISMIQEPTIEEPINVEEPTIEEPIIEENQNVEEPKPITDDDPNVEENIGLDIEELDIDTDIKEIDEINVENDLETITLKKPNEVYFELYKEARTKAKEAKRAAIIAYLEAKNIKKTYMLDDLNDSDSDFDAEIEDVSESELDGL